MNEIIIENMDEVKQEVSVLVKSEIEVVDQQSFALANGLISRLQAAKKKVQDFFADPKKKAAEAHKSICNREREMLSPLEARINALKLSTQKWYAAEQARIAAEAERKRREAEEMARLAAEAEEQGDTATAEEATMEAVMAEASVSVAPKCAGTLMREFWRAVVIDPYKVPRQYLIVDQKALDGLAKTMHDRLSIPGVRFERTFVNATRAAK